MYLNNNLLSKGYVIEIIFGVKTSYYERNKMELCAICKKKFYLMYVDHPNEQPRRKVIEK